MAPADGGTGRKAEEGWTQNFEGFHMNPLGSMAVRRPQDDEEVCRLRTSGKVTPVCPCLCTQPVVVTFWDIPMHLIHCSNICSCAWDVLRAGKMNDHLPLSPRRSRPPRCTFLSKYLGNESEFLHEVFCFGSPGLAVRPVPRNP